MFGPHVTNLGADDRSLTHRHTAYYERRASGGAGVVVVEGASVHPSDWPYERAPLAAQCGSGWSTIAAAVQSHGALAIASLDHSGGQGSSAFSQSPLWAPSRVPEVNAREVPKWMEVDDIDAVIAGFVTRRLVLALQGWMAVEINAGQHSLVRQFMSALTNHRNDEWGANNLQFARRVIEAVRAGGSQQRGVLGLRLSCDELAPWAGITPEWLRQSQSNSPPLGLDFLVVTRGSIYSVEKNTTRFS